MKDWFASSSGFYTIIFLVVRVAINIPCITIILVYHLDKSKRNKYLNNMLKPLQQNIMNGEVLKQYNNLKLDQNMANENSGLNKFPVFIPMPRPENFHNHLKESAKVNLNREENSNGQNINNCVYYRFKNPDEKILIQVRPTQADAFKHHFINIDDIQVKSSNQNFKFDIDKNIFPFDQSNSFLSDAMTSSSISDFENKKYQNDPNGLRLVWTGNNQINSNLNFTNGPILTQTGHIDYKQKSDKLPMYNQNDPSQFESNFIYQRFPTNQINNGK